jgi:predicted transcriptional regulator of viral defense system
MPQPPQPPSREHRNSSGEVSTSRGDGAIARVAGRQKGLVRSDQLRRIGLTADDIEYRRRVGRLHSVHRGVYAVGHPQLPRAGRFLAAVLAVGDDAVLCDISANVHLGLLDHHSDDRVHVMTPRDVRDRPGIRVHTNRSLTLADWTLHDGIRTTTPARSIFDLAATHPKKTVRAALRNAEVRKQASHHELSRLLDAHPTSRGVATIRELLQRGPAPTRSKLEDDVLDRLARLGRPEPNARIAGKEFDFVWADHGVILEVDGPDWHGTPTTDAIDLEKEAVARRHGFEVVRLEP